MKKFLKWFLGVLTGVLVLGLTFAVVVQWSNSKLELSQKRMLFTNDWTTTGTKVMDINSGGNIIAYWPLVDGNMNPFATGGILSGYLTWWALSGYLTGETDPVYLADSGLYCRLTWGQNIYGLKDFQTAINVSWYASYEYTGNMWGADTDFSSKWYVDNGLASIFANLTTWAIPYQVWGAFYVSSILQQGGHVWVNIPGWGSIAASMFTVFGDTIPWAEIHSTDSTAVMAYSANWYWLDVFSEINSAGYFNQVTWITGAISNGSPAVVIHRYSTGAYNFSWPVLQLDTDWNSTWNYIDAIRDGTAWYYSLKSNWDMKQINTSSHYFSAIESWDTANDWRILSTGNNLVSQLYTGGIWQSILIANNSYVKVPMVRQDATRHSYWWFHDWLTPLTITGQNIRTKITNSTGDLWSWLESDWMYLSNDEMVIENTGHYHGSVSFSVSSIVWDDFFIRIFNVTQNKQEWFIIWQSANGNTNYIEISLQFYIDANAWDHFIMQIENTTNANDPSIRNATYDISYLHD